MWPGKGLVILTGCGHAGIVNICRYAQRLTGVDQIYAVIGGFHLNGPLFEPIIGGTVGALAEFAPEVIVPAHCTGWKATMPSLHDSRNSSRTRLVRPTTSHPTWSLDQSNVRQSAVPRPALGERCADGFWVSHNAGYASGYLLDHSTAPVGETSGSGVAFSAPDSADRPTTAHRGCRGQTIGI